MKNKILSIIGICIILIGIAGVVIAQSPRKYWVDINGIIHAVGMISSTNSPITLNGLTSSSGVPIGGFIPITGFATPTGCDIKVAGGDMSVGADGVQMLLDCAEQGGSGMFFQMAQHDNGGHPKDLFSIRREGFTNAQGFEVVQGNYSSCGHPGGGSDNCYYQSMDYARAGLTDRTIAVLNIRSDVHSSTVPNFSIWGVTDGIYNGTPRGPLYQHYGTTFIHAGLFTTTFGSKSGGTILESLEDNGNHFSNQVVRTSSVYTNATTTFSRVGLLGIPILSGRTYAFEAKLYITSGTGGVKLQVNSTKTSSIVRYDGVCIHHAAVPVITSSGFATALNTVVASSPTSLVSGALCTINGTVTMSGGTSTELSGAATNASPTLTFASTTGVVVNQLLRRGTVQSCNTLTGQAFVNSFVGNTSVTLSENAACNSTTTSWSFLDTLYIEAASNAAGILTIAQGSTFELKGSINGGVY